MALRVKGHLFDSMAINRIFDACQKLNVKFNILDLQVGNDELSHSQCVLQIFDNEKHLLMDALEQVMEIGESNGLDIM